jgi:hypothetical protein
MYPWKYHKEITFILNKQKCHFFLLKIGKQEGRIGPEKDKGLVPVVGRRWWAKKWDRRMNMA